MFLFFHSGSFERDYMTTQGVKRKLTAILSADVKGYSRLMGEDEEWTVRTLNVYKDVMGNLIQQHRGRVVDATGDNLMAEFASVVDAVQCAVEIQQVLRAKNALLPENRRMEFRIGINLGDVIEEGERIYGDGVNIAARLEGLAEAGGICISGSAYEQIENKLPLRYDYLGEHEVKNIARPVRVYKAQIEPEAVPEKKAKPRQWQMVTVGLVVAVIVVVAAFVIWKLYIPPTSEKEVTSKEKIVAPQTEKPSVAISPSAEVAPKEKVTPPLPEKVTKSAPPPPPQMEVASKERMAFPLPDKPSIAVLPSANMSGDPGQDFLVDGITENIITALSSLPQLFVIARNSTFIYKGKAVKVQQVAEELGVRYVLEGSIVRSGDRIRVTAQLIDALKGHHLWAERYDRELKGLFPKSLEIYLKFLQGIESVRIFNVDSNNRARQLAEECIALEPDFYGSYLLLGGVHIMDYWLGSKNPMQSLDMAIKNMERALALTDSKGRVLEILGYAYAMKKDYDKAIDLGEQAIALVPNGADAYLWLAMSLDYVGRREAALPLFEKAMRLNPFPPSYYYLNCGHAHRLLGRFEEARAMYKKAIQLTPNNLFAHSGLAATYALMGKEEEARAEAAEVLQINPKFSVEYMAKISPYKRQEDTDQYMQGLRKAGLK